MAAMYMSALIPAKHKLCKLRLAKLISCLVRQDDLGGAVAVSECCRVYFGYQELEIREQGEGL